ncbi:hypothetical protein N431DRAFT_487497 [Stipitochalara longipes BDJ]|nr:hypothetical protein N431DRAFT_487497 [Stipitochalara longipes BDJ]
MALRLTNSGIPQAATLHGDDQTTFPCSICSKQFTKRLSRNRHVLYCRQMQLRQHHSRKKSCTLCRRAKTRCSETVPQCLRCKAKGLVCKYDGERRINFDLQLLGEYGSDSRIDRGVDLTTPGTELAMLATKTWQLSSLDSRNEESPWSDFQLNSLPPHDPIQNSLHNPTNSDWDIPIPQDEGLYDSFGSYSLDQIAQDMCNSARQPIMSSYSSSGQITSHPQADSSLFSSPQGFLQDFSDLNMAATDTSLLSARAARIEPISSTARKIGLFRRRERSFGSQLSAYYLLQTLRSYPKMMSSGNLPPFIHEYGDFAIGSTEAHNSFLPEPLAICKSIMCMYFSKTSASTSFVWRTIEMELSRLETEYLGFDEKTLMSALQALTIYILIATLEEDNLSPGIDVKMLHVMIAVATKIEDPNYTYRIAQYGVWHKWILQESRDRTFTLLFIINKLFDINPTNDSNICNAILAMPIPAHKSLWQASSHSEWKKVHTEFLQKREGRPTLTYRDMVELHQKTQVSQKDTLGDMDDWFLNLDGFGTFVLMTATSI